jgi:uncharacterized protein
MRILGIDDGPFDRDKKQDVLVVGTVYRGGNFMDGLLSCKIRKDGTNATDKLIQMINASKFHSQLRCIMLKGIAVGGFNVIDLYRLNKKTGIPVLVVIKDYPDFDSIYAALRKIGKVKEIALIQTFPQPVKLRRLYVQPIQLSVEDAQRILQISSTHADIPEPLRIAHLIASGIISGESKGRA